MSNIIVIGASYSGKTHFIKTILSDFTSNTLFIGDLCRAQGGKLNKQFSPEEIAYLVDETPLQEKETTIVIDNLFKTRDGVRVLDIIKSIDLSPSGAIVYEIIDLRSEVDFLSRGRPDDEFIQMKRQVWERERDGIMEELFNRRYTVRRVLNTDQGWLIEGCD